MAHITLSSSINIAGNTKITHNILTMAPRAIRLHIELIISISEYTATPKVAAKKPNALTIIDGIDVSNAVVTEFFLSFPSERSRLYLVVINMASTPRDSYADIVINGKIGEVLSQIEV